MVKKKTSKKRVVGKKQAKKQVKGATKKLPSNPVSMGENLATNLGEKFGWGF